MKLWRMPRRGSLAGAPGPASAADDAIAQEAPYAPAGLAGLTGALFPMNREGTMLEDACREMQQTRMSLQVDDDLTVPIILTDQNANAIVELTQRAREHRERERSSIPPVYDFGRDASWPGGGE